MIWQQVMRAVKMFTPCGNNLNGGNIFFSGRENKKVLTRALSCIQTRGPSLSDYRSGGLKSSGHLPILHKERLF